MRSPSSWFLLCCVTSGLAFGCRSSSSPTPSDEDPESSSSEGGAGGTDQADTCGRHADCDDRIFCNGPERCAPDARDADAAGCIEGDEPCGAGLCDEKASACTSDCSQENDADDDGFVASACGGDDCDDTDPERFPGNIEVCDAENVDEDCDGTSFGRLDADRDGYISMECCNRQGKKNVCGDDCNDSEEGMHPTEAENCDGLDNDCDGDIDEGFECAVGDAAIACTTESALPGERVCTSQCARDVCRTAEVCNGLDDDLRDGADDTFVCQKAALGVACDTACGTSGTGTCADDCSGIEQCVAATETCNYCDDNGANGISEEKPMATQALTVHHQGISLLGPAIQLEPEVYPAPGIYSDFYYGLLGGQLDSEVAGLWLDPGAVMGWSGVELEVTLVVRGPEQIYGGQQPYGGWAVSLVPGTVTLGGAGRSGIPDTSLLAFEWNWGHGGNSTEFEQTYDSWRIRGISGEYWYEYMPMGIPQETHTAFTTQNLYLKYVPDDPTTQANEEYFVAKNGRNGTLIGEAPHTGNGTTLNNHVPIGTPFAIAITAASNGMPFEAKVLHQTIYIDPEQQFPEYIYPVTTQVTGLCP